MSIRNHKTGRELINPIGSIGQYVNLTKKDQMNIMNITFSEELQRV